MIVLDAPQLQIDFAFALEQIRQTYLQEALSDAVNKLDVDRSTVNWHDSSLVIA